MRIELLIEVNVKTYTEPCHWDQYTLLIVGTEICMLVMCGLTVLVETFGYNVTAVSCLCYFGRNCVVSKRKKLSVMRSDRDDHPLKKGEL